MLPYGEFKKALELDPTLMLEPEKKPGGWLLQACLTKAGSWRSEAQSERP